jgi:cytochrome c-L
MTSVYIAESEASAAVPDGGELTFNHVLDKSRIEFTCKPEQQIIEAVANFHKTAKNAYSGDAGAIAGGKELYERHCAACHLKDGKGRIGPNLTDDEWRYPQVVTDKAMTGTPDWAQFVRRADVD